MNFQEITTYILFTIALGYVARRIYKMIRKRECKDICSGCGSVNLSKPVKSFNKQ